MREAVNSRGGPEMQRSYKDIPLFKDVTDDQWNDYRWQLRHRLTTTDDFAQVLAITRQ